MSVKRQENWLGQQRVDVPHLRAVESSICGDFDLIAGSMMAGQDPLVLKGFALVTTGITLAVNLQLAVAGSLAIHYLASESGSIFGVPANCPNEVLNTTNTRVVGSFTPGQINYVGVDFIRTADPATVDLVEFINPNTEEEAPVSTPLARTIDYSISISTLDFDSSPSIAPIAIVTVDSTGVITSFEDARLRMFRLGSGGTAPNLKNSFTWAAGRNEALSADGFAGGDKVINSFKQWFDAVMTRLWEVGGGEYWYSSTADRNVVMTRTGAVFSSSGEYFEWTGTNLHWQGLGFSFTNSTGVSNAIEDQTISNAGQTDLADGECIFVDLDRTVTRAGGTALTAQKATLAQLGDPTIPGARWVVAWRFGSSIFVRDQSYPVGSAFSIATVTVAGMVKLSASNANNATPVYVATVDAVSFVAKAAGLSRGFKPGQSTPSMADDFIGGTGDITIGGGWDGADGTGGGNPVDFNVFIQTIRTQDVIYLAGLGSFIDDGVATVSISNPWVDNSRQANAILTRFCVGDAPGSLRSVFHVGGDGSLGFVNQEDALVGGGGVPLTPAPIVDFEVRSKLFTRTNGLASPNKRDQLCWIMWDGNVFVIHESAPY